MLIRLGTVDEVVYKTQPQKLLLAAAVALMMLSLPISNSSAWNLPGHMVSGAIAYQILQRENPSTIPTVRSILEKIRGTKVAGKYNWINCQRPSATKCSSCSLRVGPMTFARGTKPRAASRGTT
jgi:hypothetical protein